MKIRALQSLRSLRPSHNLLRPTSTFHDRRIRHFASGGGSAAKGAHYAFEKSSYLLFALPVTICLNVPTIDLVYPIIIGYHSHFGMKHIAEDYFKKIGLPIQLVYLISGVTIAGMVNCCLTGPGISPTLHSWMFGKPLATPAVAATAL